MVDKFILLPIILEANNDEIDTVDPYIVEADTEDTFNILEIVALDIVAVEPYMVE
jgi:hypothetical protein